MFAGQKGLKRRDGHALCMFQAVALNNRNKAAGRILGISR